MAIVNYDSIKQKALSAYSETSKSFKTGKINSSGLKNATRTLAEESIADLRDCITDAADSKFSALGFDGVADTLSNPWIWEPYYSEPILTSQGGHIKIKMVAALSTNDSMLMRPSLVPEKYDPVNISELYDNGVDGVIGHVSGEWHGMTVSNRRVIPAGRYIEEGVANFKYNYMKDYIESISIY